MKRKNNYKELLWTIAVTDFKLRYHGSYLGYLWTLLKPLAIFGVLYVVFSVFMRWDVENYQLYLLLGILLWNFFAETSMSGIHSLATKVGIIKKVYFPRVLLVIASTVSGVIGLFFNLVVYALFAFFSGIELSWTILLFLPLLFLLYVFVLGMSLLLASLYIKFRDMNQIWDVMLQIGFWLTPIIYPLALVGQQYKFWLFLNPMTGFIQYSRLVVNEQTLPALAGVGYIATWAFATLVLGWFVFKKFEYLAPEEL